MAVKNNDTQEFFRKKIRIALLGEPSLLTHSQVTELCKKFFDYGMEHAQKGQETILEKK